MRNVNRFSHFFRENVNFQNDDRVAEISKQVFDICRPIIMIRAKFLRVFSFLFTDGQFGKQIIWRERRSGIILTCACILLRCN